jgi:MFS family permease
VLLVLLRLLQGFGAGAEQAGGATLLTESAQPGRRGRLASFVMVGAACGTAFGTLLFALLQFLFGQQHFAQWAWRIVFWLSALVTVAAFVIRRHLDESPVFEEMKHNAENRKAQAAPLKVALTKGWPRILQVFLMNWGQNTQSYIVQTFFVTFVTTMVLVPGSAVTHFSKGTITNIQLIGALFGMFTAYMWGRLSDSFGRKKPYLVVAGLCVVLPFVYFPIMETGQTWLVLIAVLLGYLTAAYGAVGIQMSYFPELFGSRYRYAGMTIAREVSAVIGGGIAPFVCTALLAKFHIWIPLAIYMAVLGLIAFASACTVPDTANRDLTLLEDAKPGEAQIAVG